VKCLFDDCYGVSDFISFLNRESYNIIAIPKSDSKRICVSVANFVCVLNRESSPKRFLCQSGVGIYLGMVRFMVPFTISTYLLFYYCVHVF
jgi:hypothetical protein